jgi:hypothetical protein
VELLGDTPLEKKGGAHPLDTLIFENRPQGIFREHTIDFGEPGKTYNLTKQFKTGNLEITLSPPHAREKLFNSHGSLEVYLRREGWAEDLKLGVVARGSGMIQLAEGKYEKGMILLKGSALAADIPLSDLSIWPMRPTQRDVDISKYLKP